MILSILLIFLLSVDLLVLPSVVQDYQELGVRARKSYLFLFDTSNMVEEQEE